MATVSFAAVGLTLYLLYRAAPADVVATMPRTAMAAGMLVVGLVVLGSLLFLWMTEPLVRQLEESEKHFRAVFNQTFQFLWLLHPDGTIVEANQAALDAAGVVPMAVQGRPLWQTRWWSGLPAQQELLHASVAEAAGGNFVRRELEIRGFGDRHLALDFSIKPLTNNEGRVVKLLAEGRDITERRRHEAERERLVEELREALANVKTLRGLLPICASCKKIRDDGGYWSQIETYLHAHSEAEFSHGICPECAKQLYPEQFARMFPELAGEKPAKE